jgi:hypothetical protein
MVLSCTILTGSWGRPLAVVLAVAGLGLPWLAPEVPPLRAIFGLAAAWHLARVIDLVAEPPGRGLGLRLWHQLGVIDTRLVVWTAPRFDVEAWARVAAALAVGFAGLWLASAYPPPLRWVGGALMIYCLAEGTFSALKGGYAAVGAEVTRLHVDPILSKTVGEFWGSRWNQVIGGWLRERFHEPLARAGWPRTGVIAAFIVSALLHVHFCAAGAGAQAGLVMGLFFVVHGVLVAVEGPMKISHWPEPFGRIWTIGTVLLTLPLFVEPFLALVPV